MSELSTERVREVLLAAAKGLVVIDPNDDGTLRRFADLHDVAWDIVKQQNPDRVGTPTWEIYAQMFRLLGDPTAIPDPPEPQGLGAVVQVRSRGGLVRITPRGEPGRWLNSRLPDEVLGWDEIERPLTIISLGCGA